MYHNLGNMLRLTFFAFFSKQGNRAHKYTMEHILLSTIHTIASMQIISHSLRCEKGCGAQARRLIDHPYFSRSRVWGSQFDTMLYLPPHSILLSKHYQVGQILRYIYLTIIMCILIISSTNKILEHQDLLLNSAHTPQRLYIFGHIDHVWPPRKIIKSHTHTHTHTLSLMSHIWRHQVWFSRFL